MLELDGNIRKVFPEAGDSDKMYIMDTSKNIQTNQDGTTTVINSMVMLELYKEETVVEGVQGDSQPQLRPVFVMPSRLETKWFKLSTDRDWFVYFRNPDDYLALLEVDLHADDY